MKSSVLTHRHHSALRMLRANGVVYYHELPPAIGLGTMRDLVEMGMAVQVDVGKNNKNIAWQIVPKAS